MRPRHHSASAATAPRRLRTTAPTCRSTQGTERRGGGGWAPARRESRSARTRRHGVEPSHRRHLARPVAAAARVSGASRRTR